MIETKKLMGFHKQLDKCWDRKKYRCFGDDDRGDLIAGNRLDKRIIKASFLIKVHLSWDQ